MTLYKKDPYTHRTRAIQDLRVFNPEPTKEWFK